MLDYTLSTAQLAELRAAHRRTRDQREADRIKAVVSLAGGWPAAQVAEVLLKSTPKPCATIFGAISRAVCPVCCTWPTRGTTARSPTLIWWPWKVPLEVSVQAHLYLTAKDVAA